MTPPDPITISGDAPHTPRPAPAAAPSRAGAGITLAWSAYLASSWTWCIGMFLPVLLVRDYGPWGFVAFAVPNVIGAAAMGWVLRRPGLSQTLVQRHGAAMRVFSAVTVLFQIFFAAAAVGASADLGGWGLLAAVLFIAVAIAGASMRPPWSGVAATLITAACAAAFLATSHVPFLSTGLDHGPPDGALARLACLAPVSIFGFLLCPYLDLTFHRARQALPPVNARAAFTLGFGAIFLAIILFTAAYAGVFFAPVAATLPLAAVLTHLLVQTGYTTGLHTHELAEGLHHDRPRAVSRLAIPGILAAALALAVGIGGLRIGAAPAIDPFFEMLYRAFMGFYGLVFPAYVLIVMVPPRGRSASPPSPRPLAAFAAAVLIAAPLYWLGFVGHRSLWLVPGLAVVFLARFAVSLRRPTGPGSVATAG